MKHTSGPWVSSSSTMVIAPNMGCHNLEEATANASLIAAAPEMREALSIGHIVMKDARDDIRSLLGTDSIIWQRMDNALRVMSEAIAKAEGRA